ncbi:MAG: glycosyltransferase [Butyrivibrio sp.]|nr:glycosyltransferase [Butyrivibrio sp.]
MRIAFVSEGLAGGGSERQTVVIAGAFSTEDKDCVYLITGDEKEKEYTVPKKVKRLCVLKGNKTIVTDAVTLLKISKKHKIDVIIGMGIYANLLVSFVRLLGGKTRVVVSERSAPKYDNLSYKSKLLRKALYWRADGYVFQTNEERKYYSRKIQKKGIVIHNPVMNNLPYKTDKRNKEIVAIGRLMPEKNYSLLLNSFSIVCQKHSEYILRIFGVGVEEEKLKKLCSQLQIEKNVVFEGFQLDVHNKITDSDIYVISSDYEGMPNALMETMAMGFPVVATDCYGGGPRELIQDGVNGLLTPRGNVESMADRIIRLIEDEQLKISMGKHAMEIRETHSEQKIADMWKRYIYSLV